MQNNAPPNIILIGFMGCGKTTIGELLAKELKVNFFDSDKEIEKKEGMNIFDIFDTKGENYFRDLESNFLKNFRFNNCVLATGGGMPCHNDNMEFVKKMGTVIYLNTPFQLLTSRLKKSEDVRPMIKVNSSTENSLLELYNYRENIYNKAEIKIDGTQSIRDVVREIINILNR